MSASSNARRVWPDGFVTEGRDKVIGNVFLSDIRYEHTIRGLQEAYFPDAKYRQSDEPRIVDIPEIDYGGTLVIQGQKGFGKSKAIRMLKETYFKGKSIIHVNFSRSLSFFSAIQRGDDVHHYCADENPLTAPLLEVVINSLARVKRAYDVVVIDEVVSVMSSISGSLITDTHRMNVLNALRKLLVAAKYVIIADALMEPVTIHFMRILRGIWSPLRIIDYTHRPQTGHDCIVYRTQDEWKHALVGAIREGKNVVVPCMLAFMVKALKRDITRAFPGISVQAYYEGPGSDNTAKAMKTIKVWNRCQVLLYSPVITAGCSFEDDHFDTQFFFGASTPYTGNVQSAIQMTSRVRSIKEKNIHVYIRDDYFGPDHPPDLILPKCHPLSPMSVLDASVKCIHLFRDRSFRSKVAGFAYDFFQHKVDAGFFIRYPCGTDMTTLNGLGLAKPLPPVRCTTPINEDALSHLSMSDIEHRLPVGNIYSTIDSAMDDTEVFDNYEITDSVRDRPALEVWAVYMTLFFLRTYWDVNPIIDFPCLKARFDTNETERFVKEKVKTYLERDGEIYRFRGEIVDLVWSLSLATVAYRKGRQVSDGLMKVKFGGNRRLALQVVRHIGSLILSTLRDRQKDGWTSLVNPNLPEVCAKEDAGRLQPHFVIEMSKRMDAENEKEVVLCLLVLEERHAHQLKDDFLRLFCQASFLASQTPYRATHLECFHLCSSQSWNLPFSATLNDCGSIMGMVQKKEVAWIRSHVGVLKVDYAYGILKASFTHGDATLHFDRLGALRAWIEGLSINVFVVGFGIWEALAEIFENDEDILERVQRFYDILFMMQRLVGEDLADLIHDESRVIGLGYHTNASESLVDAFVDIKQSKGFTYLFPNETIISMKCGDVMCIGDCLTLVSDSVE